ncbi:hemin-degrading factor (plasmid) [Falsihalocynthiibacter sp. SS001]|uniref:hemin-degrading factor n=1 Tax=Falsihalocynthiibacter sp. SS001 TaxID=3349698 RepID=UPI0036D3E72C
MNKPLNPSEIRKAQTDNQDKRARDLAATLGISEADLVAAQVGFGVTRIAAHPDTVMPLIPELGEVMALTRNESCVHERTGTFEKYHSGEHASMVLGKEIDTRIFPKHWVYGFAVETETPKGPRRSLQFFDAAGDAVQKIYLRDTSNIDAWEPLVAKLKEDDQSQTTEITPTPASEPAKMNESKRDILLDKWARLTDTHQFGLVIKKLGMNRLGSYRHAAGERWVRRVENDSVEGFLNAVSDAKQKVIFFVGSKGNIQIHWGTLDNIKVMGPWLNVLDPRFNLHLRGDHVSEVYVVEKPTKRGPAISLEAFDAKGGLIFQCFGQRDDSGELGAWTDILAALPDYSEGDA